MTSTKKILFFSICGMIILIGVIVLAAIAVAVIFATLYRQQPLEDFAITISTPTLTSGGQAFSNGFIYLEFSMSNNLNIQDNVIIYLDGVQIYSIKQFPSNLEIPTQGLSDGNHTISIRAVSIDNRVGFESIQVLVEDPKLSLISIDYPNEIYPGFAFTISVEVNGSATHFVANYSSLYRESVIVNSTILNGTILSSTVIIPVNLSSDEGFHMIPLNIIGLNGRSLYVPGIEVFFQPAQTNPFTIEVGIIELTSFPLDNATNGTDFSLNFTIPQDISITTGHTVTISLGIGLNSTASAILVGFIGYAHHFVIPITSLTSGNTNARRSAHEQNATTQSLNFDITLPSGSLSGFMRSSTSMQIRLMDLMGNLGPILQIPTTLSVSNTGTLHARLTWYQEVDLDLHVIDPNGEEIYYGDSSSSGQPGFLDLDSNPACRIDHRKIENIYYQNAISGVYTVRVDYYANCGITSLVNFEVSVGSEGCNAAQTINGSFTSLEADGGGRGSGREVLVFNATCSQHIVQGDVTCWTLNNRCLLRQRFNPIGSIVRVVDNDGIVLGQSQVRLGSSSIGLFSIPYEPIEASMPVYVELLSSDNKIKVWNHDEEIHVYRDNNAIIPNLESPATRNIEIDTDAGSGAFYIMKTISRMIPVYYEYSGIYDELPLKVVWERGTLANNIYGSSYFSPATNKIYIKGISGDPDEFDDSVLLHEFGHLILKRTGAVITGGGPHGICNRIAPNFAFSEGYATYLGQKEIGNLRYCDSPGFEIDHNNLRDECHLARTRTLGTSLNGHSSGDISESVVTSVAYKLDSTFSLGMLMVQALTNQNKLLKMSNYNRLGDPSAVDMADMVSLVVCPLSDPKKTELGNFLYSQYDLPWITETNFCSSSEKIFVSNSFYILFSLLYFYYIEF